MDILKDILFQVLQLALEALLPVLIGFAIKWLRDQIGLLKSKLSESQLAILDAAAKIAVLAAEQLNLAGFVEDKKAEAIRIAQQYLAAHGVELDVQVIADAIEAAVMEQFNQQQLPAGA